MNTTATAIHQALTPLVGLPLREIGRAANMLWLTIGELREVPRFRGGTKMVGDWAIHVQCAWRLCQHGQIIVATGDFYYDSQGNAIDDWDTSGKSHFDHRSTALTMEFENIAPTVVSIVTDDVGGFSLEMSNGYRLDVFPNHSGRDEYSEHWRLLAPHSDADHFVVR